MFDRVLYAPYSGVFLVNFEQLAFIILNLFLLLTMNIFNELNWMSQSILIIKTIIGGGSSYYQPNI